MQLGLLGMLSIPMDVVKVPQLEQAPAIVNCAGKSPLIPLSSTFTLEVEGLTKVELLTFGKSPNSFRIAVDKKDVPVLNQWKDKRSASIRIETPTGDITTFSMTGALVKTFKDNYNIEVTYDTISSPTNKE